MKKISLVVACIVAIAGAGAWVTFAKISTIAADPSAVHGEAADNQRASSTEPSKISDNLPASFKRVTAPGALHVSLAIPDSWHATSTFPDIGLYQSPDIYYHCKNPNDPSDMPCLEKGATLRISAQDIYVTMQTPSAFKEHEINSFDHQGTLEDGFDAPHADAVVVGRVTDSWYGFGGRNEPEVFTEKAFVLKNKKEYTITVETVTSLAEARSIIATALQTLQ